MSLDGQHRTIAAVEERKNALTAGASGRCCVGQKPGWSSYRQG